MNNRKYAEDLLGPLNRDIYENQRNVINKTFETDWKDLQNKYKNLQEELKRKQTESNIAFNKGLVDVAENSYDRLNSINANLANRGLTSSGIRNKQEQQDITTKGRDVLNLLGQSGDVSINTVKNLASGNQNLLDKSSSLGKELSNLLGDIGDAETQAQINYNSALADLAESKAARDDANDLAAKQRAASRASSGSSKEEDDLEEFYKRVAMSEIITNPYMSDQEKEMNLTLHFGVNNPANFLNAYNDNLNAQELYDADVSRLQRTVDSLSNDFSKELGRIKEKSAMDNYRNSLNETIGANSALGRSYVNPNANQTQFGTQELNDLLNSLRSSREDLYRRTSQGVTYNDLANLLYNSLR